MQLERLLERPLERTVVRQQPATARRDGARADPVGASREVLEGRQRILCFASASRAHQAFHQVAAGEDDARLPDAAAGERPRHHLEVRSGLIRPPPPELEEAEGRAPPRRDRGVLSPQAPPDLGGLGRSPAAVGLTPEARPDARGTGQGEPARVGLLEGRRERC